MFYGIFVILLINKNFQLIQKKLILGSSMKGTYLCNTLISIKTIYFGGLQWKKMNVINLTVFTFHINDKFIPMPNVLILM